MWRIIANYQPRLSMRQDLNAFLRKPIVREFWGIYITCIFLHYYYFDSRFLKQDIVMGGDTQLVWSFFYFQIYSLLHFHEFAWWDPTALNGFPSYFYSLSVFVSYFSPYSILALVFAFVGHLFGMSINTFLILHKTVISHGLNLLAIMLISRELIRHPLARVLPALLFTLSEISFAGFRDAVLYENLPQALFYVFGLVYFNNRRTPLSLLVFVFFTGALFASLNYPFVQSGLWWTTTFTIMMLLFFPDMLGGIWRAIAQIGKTRRGQLLLALACLYCIAAFAAFFTPHLFNLGHVIRVSGSGPISYDLSLAGDFDTSGSILAWPAWTNFLMWAPLPELHDKILKFDPWGAGIDHRYLGMVTLPLLAAALLQGINVRYALVTFLTFAICALFITLTVKNLALLPLIERFPILQNIRTMSNTMPREGPSIMVMLLAGIGLDGLLRSARASNIPWSALSARACAQVFILSFVFLSLLAFGVGLGLLSASNVGLPVRDALSHMAIYLTASALLCLALLLHSGSRAKLMYVGFALLIVTFMDMTISASAYWQRGIVWFKNEAVHRYPNPTQIGAITSAEQNWPGSYRGLFHNAYAGPFYGIKTWLVLAFRPAWQPVLVNWDAQALTMKAYPSFQFFTNGKFVPFDTIKTIDSMPVPADPLWFEISADGTAIESIDGAKFPISKGMAGAVEHVSLEGPQVRFSGWAIDEPAKKVPQRIMVFAGGRMWAYGGRPNIERSDIIALGGGYRDSGFAIVAKGLPADQRVGIRVFAILADGTARELSYSAGYPFASEGAPSRNPIASMSSIKNNARVLKTFYIHDQTAISGVVGDGSAVKDVPVEILRFSPNTVSVRVTAPSDVFMLSNDNYDQFWTARVDGSIVPIYRANYTFKAIRLPAGEHVVEWHYDPWPVKLMWILFYLVFGVFVLAAVKWHRGVQRLLISQRTPAGPRPQVF